MNNREQLRKEVIKTGSVEAQKQVIEWLETIGERIYPSTKRIIDGGRGYTQSIIFEPVGKEWIRSWSETPTITLENAKLKYKNDMKTYEVTRKQLQEIYPNVCKDWQSKINKVASTNPLHDVFEVEADLIEEAYDQADVDQIKWLDMVFPEFRPELVVGRWYSYGGGITCYQGQKGYLQAFGVRSDGSWMGLGNCGNSRHKWKEATEQQVLEVLTKEAKRRGLVKGVKVDFEVFEHDIRILQGEYNLDLKTGYFAMGRDILLHFSGSRMDKWNDKIVKEPEIDYSRLKTGSKVKIKFTSCHVDGIGSIDLDYPVDIVFYKTVQRMYTGAGFITADGHHKHYITFHQNGKYCVFSSDTSIDYITEVIEY